MYEHKKIFILGMARSGYEAAKILLKRNNKVSITDMKEQDELHVKELKELGATYVVTDAPADLLNKSYDLIIKNPGITYEHPCILRAKELGIKIINEVELAYNLLPKNVKIVAITGSNGKTTTTTITYELLKTMGEHVHLGGNIGYPMCSLLERTKEGDILVLEISGHQLHDCENFKTDISIMTNLSEVHLDFFKTYENYKYNKLKIFDNHTNKDIAILNLECEDVMNGTKDIKSHKFYFSSKQKTDSHLKDGYIYYKDEPIIATKDIIIKGNHNYENIMASIIAAKHFNISNETIKEVISKFPGVEHRIEFVANINGREFYNDSKSTNVKSTQIALSSFTNPTILILGGLDRGHSFEDLKDYMKHVKHIVCYGQTKDRIKAFSDSINIKCSVLENLNEAVKECYTLSDEKDIIMLSPACASWDQYKDFEERGKDFKNSVMNLK